jgi:hypothetical protein
MTTSRTRPNPIDISIAAQNGLLSVLELRGPDVRPRLDDVRRALFELRIQVVRQEGDRKGLVERLHLVEFDGARIAPERRNELLAELTQRLMQPGLVSQPAFTEHV